MADEQALYEVAPSFVELLPWVEFLPQSMAMLLEDGQSVAAFYELVPLGTEGREPGWLAQARDAFFGEHFGGARDPGGTVELGAGLFRNFFHTA